MAQLFGKKTLVTTAIVLGVVLIVNIALLVAANVRLSAVASTPAASAAAPATQAAPAAPVSLTIINKPDCPECQNATVFRDELAQIGVNFSQVRTVSYGSSQASSLISQYGITKLPALVFSKDLSSYPNIVSAWSNIGTVASDGSYLLQGALPPYYDLQTNTVRGLVNVTYLNASSCPSCYDVTLHRQILRRFGMALSDERVVDISSPEGKALVARYNISGAPTILLTGDAGLYPRFSQAWQSVGTLEPDGTFVFRNLDVIGGTYLNLSSGKTVTPAPQNATQ